MPLPIPKESWLDHDVAVSAKSLLNAEAVEGSDTSTAGHVALYAAPISKLARDENFCCCRNSRLLRRRNVWKQLATAATVGRNDAATSGFGLKYNLRKAVSYPVHKCHNVLNPRFDECLSPTINPTRRRVLTSSDQPNTSWISCNRAVCKD